MLARLLVATPRGRGDGGAGAGTDSFHATRHVAAVDVARRLAALHVMRVAARGCEANANRWSEISGDQSIARCVAAVVDAASSGITCRDVASAVSFLVEPDRGLPACMRAWAPCFAGALMLPEREPDMVGCPDDAFRGVVGMCTDEYELVSTGDGEWGEACGGRVVPSAPAASSLPVTPNRVSSSRAMAAVAASVATKTAVLLAQAGRQATEAETCLWRPPYAATGDGVAVSLVAALCGMAIPGDGMEDAAARAVTRIVVRALNSVMTDGAALRDETSSCHRFLARSKVVLLTLDAIARSMHGVDACRVASSWPVLLGASFEFSSASAPTADDLAVSPCVVPAVVVPVACLGSSPSSVLRVGVSGWPGRSVAASIISVGDGPSAAELCKGLAVRWCAARIIERACCCAAARADSGVAYEVSALVGALWEQRDVDAVVICVACSLQRLLLMAPEATTAAFVSADLLARLCSVASRQRERAKERATSLARDSNAFLMWHARVGVLRVVELLMCRESCAIGVVVRMPGI